MFPLQRGRIVHTISLLIRRRIDTRISAEVTKPFDERKFDGIFTIATELSPLASPAFEIGRYAGFESDLLLLHSLTLRL